MRLREIKKILEENIPNLDAVKFGQEGNMFVVYNYNSIYKNLLNIRTIEPFFSDVDSLLNTEPFQYNEVSKIFLNADKYNFVINIIKKIKTEGELLITLLKNIVKEQDKYTFSFKLYEFESLKEYRKFCDDLQVRILDPLNKLNVEIKLGELEEGSRWMSIVASSILAFSIFSSIVRETYDVLIHDHQRYRVIDDLASTLELESELHKKFIEAVEKRRENHFDRIAKKIINDINSDPNLLSEENATLMSLADTELTEYENSIRISMNCLAEHLDRGLEVYHALDRKEEDRYKLPDFSKLLIDFKKTKRIENKNDNTKTD